MSPNESSRPAVGRLAASGIALLLAGCMSAAPPSPPAPPPPRPVAVDVPCAPALEASDFAVRHLLATFERLNTLNTQDLGAEAARPAEAGAVQGQMDQALALALTHAPGDLARAQALLDQVIRNPGGQADAWRAGARLLAALLGEARRAEDAADKSAQQLRDAQRDNQRKLDQLNEKLEQLKAIERSLNTRPAAAASRPGP